MPTIDLKKPRTVAEYEKFLNGRERITLQRFWRFLALISETRDIAPFDLYPDELFIEKIKFNRRTLLFGDAWNILYQLSESFLSVFPTQPIFHEESKSKTPKGLTIRYQRDEEPYATNLKNFQTAISNVYRGAGTFGSFFTVKEKAGALSRILTGLFRDDLFHRLDDQGGGEFYIDIFDELLADDDEARQLLNSKAKSVEELVEGVSRIETPYIKDIIKKLLELEKDGWIKLKSVKSNIIETGEMDIATVDGAVMPAGKVSTLVLVVKATKINWRKFIESVSERSEKANLQWDNIFSDAKQKSLVINLINERRKELDRDDDIIVSLKSWNYNEDRIHTLRTLEGLERDGLITLGGFKIREPDTYDKLRGVPGSFALKAELSVTRQFKERIQEIEAESAKNRLMGKSNFNQKQKKEISKPIVVIDLDRGIYDDSSPERVYEISGKRKKVVEYLGKNDVVPLSELVSVIDQQDSLVVKEISEINKKFKDILGVKTDLVVRSKTAGGYSLNKREFTIKAPETSA